MCINCIFTAMESTILIGIKKLFMVFCKGIFFDAWWIKILCQLLIILLATELKFWLYYKTHKSTSSVKHTNSVLFPQQWNQKTYYILDLQCERLKTNTLLVKCTVLESCPIIHLSMLTTPFYQLYICMWHKTYHLMCALWFRKFECWNKCL